MSLRIAVQPHVPHSMTLGGSEVQLRQTSEALKRLGHTVEPLNWLDTDQLKTVDIVHFFGCVPGTFKTLSDYLPDYNIKYVCSTIYYPKQPTSLRYRIRRKLGKSYDSSRESILQRASTLLPNSEAEKKRLLSLFRLDPNRFSIVPNGINPLRGFADPEYFRKTYLPELSKEERFVLCVGRIENRKNSIRLLEACNALDIPIVFIGPNATYLNKYVADFQALFASAKCFRKHIPSLEYDSPELWSAFSACHVHSLVSEMETPGLASLEAGLTNANLVYGQCEPVEEYLADIGTGVDPLSVASIKQGLEKEMNSLRGHLNPEEKIRNNYSWDIVARKTEEAYLQALNETVR